MSGISYVMSEWLDFLTTAEDDNGNEIPFDADIMDPLQAAFEARIESLLSDFADTDACKRAGYTEHPADLLTDAHIQLVSYLSFASLVGHGVGLWEEREPWHAALETVVEADPTLRDLVDQIEQAR